jgi:hypothetical protein
LHDDVGDDLIRSRIALRRAIGVLDDVDPHRPDEPIGADLQHLVRAGIRRQHQGDQRGPEQGAMVRGLGIEAHARPRASTVSPIGPHVLAKVPDEPIVRRAKTRMAHAPSAVDGHLAAAALTHSSKPALHRSNEPRHLIPRDAPQRSTPAGLRRLASVPSRGAAGDNEQTAPPRAICSPAQSGPSSRCSVGS